MSTKKAVIFLTDGFEEMEALVPLDILMRADIKVKTLSITGKLEVNGCHAVRMFADALIADGADDINNADMLILPGGPGAGSYIECKELCDAFLQQAKKDKHIAAICAAPVTLGKLGLLDGKKATCYPGRASELIAGERLDESVVIDGKVITGRAAGSAVDFGLALTKALSGDEGVAKAKGSMYID